MLFVNGCPCFFEIIFVPKPFYTVYHIHHHCLYFDSVHFNTGFFLIINVAITSVNTNINRHRNNPFFV